MSRKKNLLDYLALTLFIMCMGLALSASLEYVTRATEREYLGQGIWVLSMAGLSLLALLLGRISRKCGQKMQPLPKNIVMIAFGAVLVGVGVYLRLWVIWNIPVEPDSDFETYYRMANHLLNDTLMSAEGAVDRRYIALYPHTIGFPMLILWPTFAIFGASVRNALYANLVCSVISILLAGHIARRIAGRTGALVAVALMSLWPSHILFSNMVATEPSFTMLILLAADMMTSVLDRRKGSLYDVAPSRMLGVMALLGIVLAIAGAIRPMAVILLAAYCVAQLCVTGDPMNEIRVEGARYATSQPIVCIVLVLVCYLVTGSVISRAISDVIGEQPASGLYASGYNLMVGLNTQSNGLWNETDSEFFAQAYDATKSATGAHQACMEVAAQRIQSEPENVLNLMVYKFRDLWRTDDFGIDWNLLWTEQQGTLTPELRSLLESIRPIGRVMLHGGALVRSAGRNGGVAAACPERHDSHLYALLPWHGAEPYAAGNAGALSLQHDSVPDSAGGVDSSLVEQDCRGERRHPRDLCGSPRKRRREERQHSFRHGESDCGRAHPRFRDRERRTHGRSIKNGRFGEK